MHSEYSDIKHCINHASPPLKADCLCSFDLSQVKNIPVRAMNRQVGGKSPRPTSGSTPLACYAFRSASLLLCIQWVKSYLAQSFKPRFIGRPFRGREHRDKNLVGLEIVPDGRQIGVLQPQRQISLISSGFQNDRSTRERINAIGKSQCLLD